MAHRTHGAVQLPNYARGVRRLLCYCRSAELDRGRHGRKRPGSVRRKTAHAADLIGTSNYQSSSGYPRLAFYPVGIGEELVGISDESAFSPWGLARYIQVVRINYLCNW